MQIETWPLVRIEWDDAESEGDEWTTFYVSDIKTMVLEPKKCVSVGYLIKETKYKVFVAPHLGLPSDANDHYQRFGAITIPRFAITQITYLAEKINEIAVDKPEGMG